LCVEYDSRKRELTHFLARGRDKRDEKKKNIGPDEFMHLLDTDNMNQAQVRARRAESVKK
jgi:hypothetical protein